LHLWFNRRKEVHEQFWLPVSERHTRELKPESHGEAESSPSLARVSHRHDQEAAANRRSFIGFRSGQLMTKLRGPQWITPSVDPSRQIPTDRQTLPVAVER
jgi:hypothetical protein